MGFGGWLSGACVGTPTFSAFPLVESGLALGREKTDHGNKAVKPTSALVRAAEAAGRGEARDPFAPELSNAGRNGEWARADQQFGQIISLETQLANLRKRAN